MTNSYVSCLTYPMMHIYFREVYTLEFGSASQNNIVPTMRPRFRRMRVSHFTTHELRSVYTLYTFKIHVYTLYIRLKFKCIHCIYTLYFQNSCVYTVYTLYTFKIYVCTLYIHYINV